MDGRLTLTIQELVRSRMPGPLVKAHLSPHLTTDLVAVMVVMSVSGVTLV